MPESPAPRRYAAFLSYRHADNREPGRRWAEWLHHALETYVVPPDLVGRLNQRGEPIPATLYPVFRDEEELSADADLSQTIRRALEASSTLVVLCSPRARASRYVDDELRAFQALGRGDRIFALLLDGAPGTAGAGSEGPAPADECLPEALRAVVPAAQGAPDAPRPGEPLAADARPGGRPEQGYTSAGAYGEALRRAGGLARREVQQLEREYATRLDLARLKVIAGILGVPLGQLRARDAAYRARRLRRLALGFGTLALLAVLGALAAVWQAGRAERNFQAAEHARRRQREQLVEASRHAHAGAERELAAGRWRLAVAQLGQALRYDRENAAASAYLWSALVYGTGDRDEPPEAVWQVGEPVEALAASPDGQQLALLTRGARLVLLDLASGTQRSTPLPVGEHPRRLRFSPRGDRLVFGAGMLQAYVATWPDAQGPLTVRQAPGILHDAAFSADGSELLLARVVGGLARVDPSTLAPPPEPGAQPELVFGAVFSDDGRHLLARSMQGESTLLDVGSGTRRLVPGVPGDETLHTAVLAPGGALLGLPGGLGRVGRVIALATGVDVVAPAITDAPRWTALAFDPHAGSVMTDLDHGRLAVRQLVEQGGPGAVLHHPGGALRAAFSSDGRHMFTAAEDGTVARWRRVDPVRPAPYEVGVPARGAAWLGPARAALLVGEQVEVWDLAARRREGTFACGPAPGGIAAAHDGSWVATGGPGGRIHLWDPVARVALRELQAPGFTAYGVSSLLDPTRLLVTGYDLSGGGLAQQHVVLDLATGRPLGPAVRLDRIAIQMGVSHDGRRLVVSLGADGPWRAWSIASGEPAAEPVAADLDAVRERSRAIRDESRVPAERAASDGGRALLDRSTGLAHSLPLGAGSRGLYWSPDGARALALFADADAGALLYESPPPAPPGPWLMDLVLAASGLELSASGQGRAAPLAERAAALGRLAAIRERDPSWARLLAWWLAAPPRGSVPP